MTNLELQKALIGVGTSIFGLYVLNIVYGIFWEHKHISPVAHLLFCILFVGAWFLIDPIQNYSIHFFCGWILHLSFTWFYQAKIGIRILISFIDTLVTASIEYSTGFLLSSLFKNNFEWLLQNNALFYFCGSILTLLVSFIIAKGLQIFSRRRLAGLSLRGILPILSFPVTSVLTGFTIMQISPEISEKGIELQVSVIFLLLTISGLYFIHITEKQAVQERTAQQLQSMKQQYRLQEIHIQELSAEQEGIRKIRHDMRHILLALKGQLESGKIQEALDQIIAQQGLIDITGDFVPTGVGSLDAILSAKLSAAKENNIAFTYQICLPKLQVDEVEFCILIGNALENALDACGQITDASKYIKLNIRTNGIYILVDTENSSLEPAGCRTRKPDRENHGFGMTSMREIVKDYDGDFSWHFSEGVFYLSVMLKNKKSDRLRHL